MNPERLYLDYNATSPLSQSVSHWLKSGDLLFGNPSSQHSSGKASRKIINESRANIFSTFGLNEKETQLFFHSGATEGFSTLAYSFSDWARLSGKDLLICYSKLDHPAVTALSERYFGPHVKFLELKIDQNLDYEHATNLKMIQEKKDDNPGLIILYHHLWVHNESGVVSPLAQLSEFKRIPDLYIHVDGVQAPGKIPDWNKLGLGDIFTFSGHKFGALKGIGFTFMKKDFVFSPLLSGGGQQSGLRSGTENITGIQSLSLALNDLKKVNVPETTKLRLELESFMKKELQDIGGIISERNEHRCSNTIYFYLNDLASDIAVALFDVQGLMISAGSACSSGAAKPSLLMTHLGFKDQAKNGLRLSLSFNSSETDLKTLKERITVVFSKLSLK